MENNERFERLYNELEDLLRIRYRLEPNASGVYYHEKRVGGQTAKNLRTLRELRNYVVHEKRTDTLVACVVTDAALAYLEKAIASLSRPRRAIDVCVPKERILFAVLSTPVRPLLAAMLERNISHVPVLDEKGIVAGVFSGTTLFARAGAVTRFVIDDQTTLSAFAAVLPVEAHVERYRFVARTAPLADLIEGFAETATDGKKTKMLFVTENGRPEERILGLITPWDILADDIVAA